MPLRRDPKTATDTDGHRSRTMYGLALLAILVLAAVLRFVGLDWDDGYYLHPDERFMVMVTVDTAWPESVGQYFDSETSPLNPYNTRHGTYVYGTFPLFLTKAISGIFGTDVYGEAHLAGRALSALADTGTVFLTAWIGRRFFGDRAGLLAGFLIAFTMLHIQSAHFYTVDAMSVFFATASFVAVVRGWDRRSIGWYAIAGLMIGLAGASKPNYLIALGFLALPVLETVRLYGLDGLIPPSRGRVFPAIPAVIVAGVVAFWTFRLGQPYAFAGPNIWNIGLNRQWVNDLSYWSSAQSGLIDIKSSVQWVGRTPVAYIVENMVRWGMGPPLGIASLAALAIGAWRVLRSRNWPSWWMTGMLGWSVIQLILYGTNIAQAQRYLLPIYPFLIALAAGLLIEVAGVIRRTASQRRYDAARHTPGTRSEALPLWAHAGTALIAVTVVYTAFYGVAFDTLYVRPLSRVQASEWIYENVSSGSTLTSEYWDDALPMPLEGEDRWQYEVITLDLYAWEGPDNTKLSELIGQLNQADYIVLSSNRIIGSVPRQPERYPMATHYYDMLVDGSLGFDLVAEFKQTPELFGIALDDTDAEETLTVYEHPHVRIFEKTDRFDIEQVYAELNEAMGYGGVNYLPGDPTGDQMFLTDAEWAAYDEAGTWSEMFDHDSLVNRAPAVWWYAGMQILALPGIPLAWALFRRFPDGGYALAKALGLVLITWLAWVISALDLLPFGRGTILTSWVIVGGSGLLAIRTHLRDFTRGLANGWRWIFATELIFLAAYSMMVWLRSHNAAFWTPNGAGETPFSLMLFNAASRSVSFPPFDAWLGGGQLHLPYWGMLPWVLVTRLTGIVPNVGHTLASVGIFAIMCVVLWSAAAALIARMRLRGIPAGWTALLAPVLVGGAGMLGVASAAGQGWWGYSPRPEDWPIRGLPGDVVYGLGNILTQRPDLTGVPVDEPGAGRQAPFTMLLTGDLNAGTTTLPLYALAIAVAVGLVRCYADHGWHGRGLLLTGGLITGAMSASATWGLTVSAALMTVAIVIRALSRHGLVRSWRVAQQVVVEVLIALGTAFIAFLPFRQEFVVTQRNSSTGHVPSLDDLALWLGGLLLIVVLYLGASLIRVLGDARREGRAGQMVTITTATLAIGGVLVAVWLGSTLVLLVVTMLFVILALWHRQDQLGHIFVTALIGLGVLLILFGPLVPLPMTPFGEPGASRLDGIAWMLFGMGAAGVLAWVTSVILTGRSQLLTMAGALAITGSLILVMAMMTAPVVATRMMTTNATDRSVNAASLQHGTGHMQDRAAARWLMENAEGLPVILEATAMDREYGGRISAMTGLPTVIGWPTPERMMRPGWEQIVPQRQEAVSRIWTSTGDFAGIEPLLVQYDVELIYIGPLERQSYDALALHKFEMAAESGTLTPIYDEGEVTIYRYTDQ